MRIFFRRVICFFLIVTMLLGNNCVSALASNTDYAAATSQDPSTYNEEVEFIDLADGETAYETDPTAGDGVQGADSANGDGIENTDSVNGEVIEGIDSTEGETATGNIQTGESVLAGSVSEETEGNTEITEDILSDYNEEKGAENGEIIEESVFEKGYVSVEAETQLFSDDLFSALLGHFESDSIVFASDVVWSDNRIALIKATFYTENDELVEGYIDGHSITVLSDEAADTIPKDKMLNGYAIPVAQFIPEKAASQDGLWTYEIIDNYAMVTGYLDYTATELAIPDMLGGCYVNAIGNQAFVKNTSLTNMYVHGNVISIADDAFVDKTVSLSGYNGTAVLAYAKAHDMNAENKTDIHGYELQEHVIDFSYASIDDYEFIDGNTVRLGVPEAKLLQIGSFFYIPLLYDNLIKILKVTGIEESGDFVIVHTEDATAEESLKSIHLEDELLTPDWDNVIWADGVEVYEEKASISAEGEYTRGIKFEKDFFPAHDKRVKSWSGQMTAFAQGTVTLSGKLSMDWSWIPLEMKSAKVQIPFKATAEGGIRASGANDTNHMRWSTNTAKIARPKVDVLIAKIPLISAYGVTSVFGALYWRFEASGEIKASFVISGDILNLEYSPDNGWQNKNTFKSKLNAIDASVELATGPVLSVEVNVAVLGKVLSLDIFGGIEIDAKAELFLAQGEAGWIDGDPQAYGTGPGGCADIKVSLVLRIELKIELDFLKKALSKSKTKINEAAGTIEIAAYEKELWKKHFEIGKGFVDKCSYEVFEVNFYTGTPEKVKQVRLLYNRPIEQPKLEQEPGTLVGWYYYEGCSGPDEYKKGKGTKKKWDFQNDKVTKDIDLYAEWDSDAYHNVIYKWNSKNSKEPDYVVQAIPGTLLTKPNDFMMMGYIFKGWYKDEDCTQSWNFDQDVMPENDCIIYAGWEKQEGYDPYVQHGTQQGNVSFNGHSYTHIMEYMSYPAAVKYAEDRGGYLMTINSAQEQDFLANYLNRDCSQQYLWMGMTGDKDWNYWSTGEPVTYENWVNKPQIGMSAYNAVMVRSTGQWTPYDKNGTAHFCIEWGEPEIDPNNYKGKDKGIIYQIENQHAVVSGYNGNDKELVIADKYQGKPVEVILENAFENNDILKKITIPNSVVTIEKEAFMNCTKLESITIPGSVTQMGSSIFKGCTSLKTVSWSQGMAEIPNNTFEHDENLINITNIANVRTVGELAFSDCSALTGILFPDKLETIKNRAFYKATSLRSISLPDTVSIIGNAAFDSCSGALKIIIPNNDKLSIGSYAFSVCSQATDIYLLDKVKASAIGYGAFNAVNGKFHVKKNSEAHTWAVNEQKIIEYMGAKQVVRFSAGEQTTQEVTDKDGELVTDMLIAAGKRITEPTVEREGMTIEDWYTDSEFKHKWDFALDKVPTHNITLYAKWIESADLFEYDISDGKALITNYNGENTEVIIPDELEGCPVVGIGERAFASDKVERIIIPASVKSIAGNAFDCSNLYEIVLRSNKYYMLDEFGVLYNAKGTILVCVPQAKPLTNYTVKDGTEKILPYAFSEQETLLSVTIPDSVKSIGEDIFYGNRLVTIYGNTEACIASKYADRHGYSYNTYRVYYYDDEGILVYSAAIRAGSLIEACYEPVTDFASFGGWYKDANCTQRWDFEHDQMPASDVSLYLKWNSLFLTDTIDSAITIKGYRGTSQSVIIPETINGQAVTEIAGGVFNGTYYKSVTIPDCVTSIQTNAIDSSITIIGNKGSAAQAYASQNGNKFTRLKYIVHYETNGGSAVNDAKVLPGADVSLPTPIRDNYYFAGWYLDSNYSAEWTDEYVMPANNLTLYARWRIANTNLSNEFGYALLNDGTAELTAYVGSKLSVSIPEKINGYTVSRIGNYAFKNNETAVSVKIPATVTSIGEYAFANTNIRKITGGANVTSIEEGAFHMALALSEFPFGNKLREVGNGAFMHCSALTGVTMQTGTVRIGENAFYNCEFLSYVSLPNTLKSIDKDAFAMCQRLKTVSLPSSLQGMAEAAFDSTCEITFTTSSNISILSCKVLEGTKLSLTWNAVKNATRYSIAKKLNTDNMYKDTGTYYSENKATISAGKTGQTVDIIVKAYDSGTDTLCTSEPVTVYLSAIETPSIESVVQSGSNKAVMTLNGVAAAVGYELERAYETSEDFKLLKTVTKTYFTNTGLTPGGDYLYRIRAYREEDGNRVYSRYSPVYRFHMPYKYITAPENVRAVQTGAENVDISWRPVDEADGYLVYRKAGQGEYKLLGETLQNTYTNNKKFTLNRKYYYKVYAFFVEGQERIISPESLEAQVTYKSVPTPVITDIKQTKATTVRLKWHEIAGVSGYVLYRSDTEEGPYNKVKTASSVEVTTTAVPGNTCYYKVCAYTIDVETGTKTYGDFSVPVSITAGDVPTVINLSAMQISGDTLKVSWTGVADIDGYEVWMSAVNEKKYELSTTVTGKYANIAGLKDGTAYYVKVRAFKNEDSEPVYGEFSDSINMTILGTPKILVAEQDGKKNVRLMWSKVNSAAGYEVWKYDDETSQYVLHRKLSATDMLQTKLEYDKIYRYKVRAYTTVLNEKKYSFFSDVQSVKLLEAPVLSDVIRKDTNTVTLNWTKIVGAKGYDVYRSNESNGVYKLIKTVAAVKTSDTGLLAGRTYYYKIVPYVNLDGNRLQGAASNVKGMTIVRAAKISQIENHSATSVSVNIKPVTGATGYKVYMDTSSKGTFNTMKKTTGTSVLFTNLTNKKRYYFKVAAYTTDDGLTSDGLVSDVTSVYFYDLAKPSFTAIVQPTETSVTLSWGKVSGATEYRLFRSEEKYGEYTRVKTVTERSSTHKGLTAGKTYYYKLRACKTIDTGEITYGVFSAPLEVRMLEKTNMFKVERTGSVSAKLNWEVVPGATGYKAYRATELNGTYEEIKAQKSTTFTNTDLTNGRTYYYKVAATKNPSGILHIGPVSKIVSISIYDIAATKITSCAQSGSGKVALVWNEAEGADGYEISEAGNDGIYHTVKRTALTSTTVGSMSDGETYSFRIRAYKMIDEKRGYGPYSSVVQAELIKTPSNVQAYHSAAKQIEISWDEVSGADSYKVYRKAGDGSYKTLATVTDDHYTDDSIISETKSYTYQVIAIKNGLKKSGVSDRSEEYTATMYPESKHNYDNSMNRSWTYAIPGASSLVICFSESSSFENNYDRLYVTDKDGNAVENSYYTGSQLAGVTITVPGDTVNLRMTSDGSVVDYGFSIKSITRG